MPSNSNIRHFGHLDGVLDVTAGVIQKRPAKETTAEWPVSVGVVQRLYKKAVIDGVRGGKTFAHHEADFFESQNHAHRPSRSEVPVEDEPKNRIPVFTPTPVGFNLHREMLGATLKRFIPMAILPLKMIKLSKADLLMQCVVSDETSSPSTWWYLGNSGNADAGSVKFRAWFVQCLLVPRIADALVLEFQTEPRIDVHKDFVSVAFQIVGCSSVVPTTTLPRCCFREFSSLG